MVKYTCLLCKKDFNKKFNYDVHSRRVIPCIKKDKEVITSDSNLLKQINQNNQFNQNPIINESTNIITDNFSNQNNQFNQNAIINESTNIITDNFSNQNNQNAIINESTNIIHACIYCNKIFSFKHNLTRHLKNKCKQHIIYNNQEIQIKNLIEQNIQLNNQNKIILQKLNSLEENIAIVSKSKNSKNNKTIKNINNIQNNNTQNNNTLNNITINHIVNIGDEDISKLTESEILGALKELSNSFLSYIKIVHVNKRLPEFNNVLINNLRSKYVKVVEDNKLKLKNRNETIKELIDLRLSEITNFINQYHLNKKISSREHKHLLNMAEFFKKSYFTDEDFDGNIIKGNKNMILKLTQFYEKLTYIFYDERDLINRNMNELLITNIVDD